MEPEITALEQLRKSIQTFGNLSMAAESRDKLYRFNDALMQSLYSILEDQESGADEKMQYLNTSLEEYAAAMKDLFPKIISGQVLKTDDEYPPQENPVTKSDPDRFDEIVEVEKFNPYHDSKGRFASANGYSSFTIRTRDPGKQYMADMAIAREKLRDAATSAAGAKPSKPKQQPEKQPEKKPDKQPEKETSKPEDSNLTIVATGKSTLPESVLATCRDVEAKTVNRKTEKLTLVAENGRIILEKGGGKGSVSFGAREGLLMDSTTTITHNHPGQYGGTFSGADVKVLVDYKLKAIRAVGKEGTYSLERGDTNSNKAYDFKQEFTRKSNALNNDIRSEYKSLKNKVARGEKSVDEANKQLSETRTTLCNEQHDWLVQNAAKYGFNYVFEPSSGGVGKMFEGITKAEDQIEEIEDSTDEIVLDGEFISGDNWMIKG